MRLLAFLLLLPFSFIRAQDSLSANKKFFGENNINIELGGTGLLYSIGYERNLCMRKKCYQSIKAGISYQPFFSVDQVFIPVDYNFYIGTGKTKLLMGLGEINLIGTHPSPSSPGSRSDYLNLYNQNPYSAFSKYGTDRFEKAFDLAYTAKLGFKYFGTCMGFYAYLNCFYIRFNTKYNFQPAWLGVGLSIKLGK